MKRCPTCNQTFAEEWLSFCTHDGTTLIDNAVDPSQPLPTVMAPAPSPEAVWHVPSDEIPPSSTDWQPPRRVVPDWQPPPPPLHVQPQNKSLATASMILGIISITIGWLCFGPISAIASIILGGVALSQIKKTPDLVGGKQMAVTGVITGSLALVVWIGLMIFYIFIGVLANV